MAGTNVYEVLSAMLLFTGLFYLCKFFFVRTPYQGHLLMIIAVSFAYISFCLAFVGGMFAFFGRKTAFVIIFMCVFLATLLQAVGFFLKNSPPAWATVMSGIWYGAVYYITLGNRKTWLRKENFIPFLTMIKSPELLWHGFLNFLLLMPSGFFLVFLRREKTSLYYAVPSGLAVSLIIESLQLMMNRGKCDIDDIILNTAGAAAGILAGNVLLPQAEERRGKYDR